jgi:hypothetical protein
MRISVVKIIDDCGFAVCDGKMRIDIYPPIPKVKERRGPTVQLFSGPPLTPAKARAYAALLEVAADYADDLAAKRRS